MILYNAKVGILEGQFIVTKFDDDLNIESSYTTTLSECDCPAGQRSTCRHRQMLPHFIAHDYADTNWFFCYDDQNWHEPFDNLGADEVIDLQASAEAESIEPVNHSEAILAADLKLNGPSQIGIEAQVTHPSIPPGEVPAVVASPGTFKRRV